MSPWARAGHFTVAFVAVMALVAGSTALYGMPFWLFSAGVTVLAAWAIYSLYVRAARAWLQESYRMLGDARLEALKARVASELQRPASGVGRSVVEQLNAEVLFWSGEFERAYDAVTAIDTSRMSELWRAATFGLRVTSSLMGGHLERARETLEKNHALLEKRPGLHHLEALVALESGDARGARERYSSVVEDWPRPRLVRGALALIEARIALALGEPAEAQLNEAKMLGGESWVPREASRLLATLPLTSAQPVTTSPRA